MRCRPAICCARATSGRAVTPLPINAMKSRRRIGLPLAGKPTIKGCFVQHSK